MNPMFLIGGGVILLILLIIGVVVSITSDRSIVEERLGRYLDEEGPAEVEKGSNRGMATEWLNRRVAKSSLGDRVARELARADLKFKVAEYYALIFMSTVVVGFVSWLLQPSSVVSGIIGAAVGFFLPRFYVKRQQGVRLQKFNDQLGDMLNLMVNGLRAGYSTTQAMEAVSKELPSPIRDEFHRVVQEMQIGIPMERSLENLLRRIPSEDLDFVVTAINVQREVGGNLSEILDTISFTIRERVRIKGEISTMTAQVRTSGMVLALIPVFLTIALWFISPEYIGSFFDLGPFCGWLAVGTIVILIVSGYFVMMKIADIEV